MRKILTVLATMSLGLLAAYGAAAPQIVQASKLGDARGAACCNCLSLNSPNCGTIAGHTACASPHDVCSPGTVGTCTHGWRSPCWSDPDCTNDTNDTCDKP
jgi:hypothetical protein